MIQIDIEGLVFCKSIAEGIVEESKHPDPVIENYKGFRIEAYESNPGLWRVRITCVDGAKIKTFPDGDEYSEINPPNESLDAESAIDFAKKKINAGGMICAPLVRGSMTRPTGSC